MILPQNDRPTGIVGAEARDARTPLQPAAVRQALDLQSAALSKLLE